MSIEDGFLKAFGYKHCVICGSWTKGKLSDFVYSTVRDDFPLCQSCVEDAIVDYGDMQPPLTGDGISYKMTFTKKNFFIFLLFMTTFLIVGYHIILMIIEG